MSKCQGLIICYILILFDSSCQLPRCPCHLRRHSRLHSHPCCLVVALSPSLSPSPSPSPCRCLAVALPSPCPPFFLQSSSSRPPSQPHEDSDGEGDCHRHHRCCCYHQRRSSCRRIPCLRCHCPDVSVAVDAPALPLLPPSFVTDPMAGRLRLATLPHQRRRQRRQRRRRRRRRRATDASAPTPDAT